MSFPESVLQLVGLEHDDDTGWIFPVSVVFGFVQCSVTFEDVILFEVDAFVRGDVLGDVLCIFLEVVGDVGNNYTKVRSVFCL